MPGAVPIVKFGIVPKTTYWQIFIFSAHYLWLKVMPWPTEGLLRLTKYDNGIFFLKLVIGASCAKFDILFSAFVYFSKAKYGIGIGSLLETLLYL